jgi:uncharacterized membrane protein YhaH (DUF805 family)
MEDGVKWYIEVMRKYAVFSGRARRQEYWMFVLSNVIIVVFLGIIDGMADSDFEGSRSTLTTLYVLATLIPFLAVGVRRLHDTGRSGWWMLIGVIPIIGAIVLLIFIIQDSQLMDNQYGPNPKREITAYQGYSVSQP